MKLQKAIMQIGVRELKAKTAEIIRRVEDGEIVEITNHGRIVARMVPMITNDDHDEALLVLHDMEQLAAEIGAERIDLLDTTTLMQEERRAL